MCTKSGTNYQNDPIKIEGVHNQEEGIVNQIQIPEYNPCTKIHNTRWKRRARENKILPHVGSISSVKKKRTNSNIENMTEALDPIKSGGESRKNMKFELRSS